MVKGDGGTVAELEAALLKLETQRDRIDQLIAEYKSERQRVLDEINHMKQVIRRKKRECVAPTVSAHALLRYLERVLEIDIGMVEKQILCPDNVAAIRAGATRITVDGVDLVIRDRVVVTVVQG